MDPLLRRCFCYCCKSPCEDLKAISSVVSRKREIHGAWAELDGFSPTHRHLDAIFRRKQENRASQLQASVAFANVVLPFFLKHHSLSLTKGPSTSGATPGVVIKDPDVCLGQIHCPFIPNQDVETKSEQLQKRMSKKTQNNNKINVRNVSCCRK